ncbi:MAG: hypothetical protein WBP12_05710 [Candidatus Saccharimonas sp.]
MKPRLYIDQKITPFINRYLIYTPDTQGEKGQQIGFVEQERFKFKEKVHFYSDDTKQQELFSFRAEKVLDIHGKYLVEDTSGTLLGYFQKDFKTSLIKSTWALYSADGTLHFTVTESNLALAILRRYIGFLPIVGDILEIVTILFKYHFIFLANEQEVGKYEKTTLFRDHYRLSMTDESYAKLDQRVLTAMSVALDALQSR